MKALGSCLLCLPFSKWTNSQYEGRKYPLDHGRVPGRLSMYQAAKTYRRLRQVYPDDGELHLWWTFALDTLLEGAAQMNANAQPIVPRPAGGATQCHPARRPQHIEEDWRCA
jgi:hypothetical protein